MNCYGEMLLSGVERDFVEAGGERFYVRCGFREVLRVIRFLETGRREEAVGYFFGEKIPDTGAFELMCSFIGEEYIPDRGKAFSFYGDAGLIAGAFMECYGIDIFSADMHWHRFCALFASLSGECAFSKLIRCRCGDFGAAEKRLAARKIGRKYGRD